MAIGTVTQVINQAAMNRLLRSPQGGVAREMLKRGARVAATARRIAPVGTTGDLRGSIRLRPYLLEGEFGVEVGSDSKHALDVIKGTGIYGPRGTPIKPKNGTYLVFTTTKSSRGRPAGQVVFTKSVRGQKPRPFLQRALLASYKV